MDSNLLPDDDITTLLVAVGAEPDITAADFDRTFEDLDLDSLARAEFAARIKDRTRVDIEDQLSALSTPNEARRLAVSAAATVR
jgi:acyl carrier protein